MIRRYSQRVLPSKRAIGIFLFSIALVVLAELVSLPVKSEQAHVPLLAGAQIDPPVLAIIQRSCRDCHSEGISIRSFMASALVCAKTARWNWLRTNTVVIEHVLVNFMRSLRTRLSHVLRGAVWEVAISKATTIQADGNRIQRAA